MKNPRPVLLALAMQSLLIVGAARAEWIPIPLITASSRANGATGGEGCQVIEQLAVDSTGNVLFAATDVGGIFRSRDGAANWEPVNIGLNSRGASGIAIDPKDPTRVLAAGGNGRNASQSTNGLYLTTNQGETWSFVYANTNKADKQNREQFIYDTTVQPSLSYTSTIYWSSPGTGGKLHRSTDGGLSWAPVTSTFKEGATTLTTITQLNDAILDIDTNGVIYAGHSTGLYRSSGAGDKASEFTRIATGTIYGLDVIGTVVYYNTDTQLFRSQANGANFTPIVAEFKTPINNVPTVVSNTLLRNLKVSPVNPNLMSITRNQEVDNPHWFSENAGQNWAKMTANMSNSFIPAQGNKRGRVGVWHPTDANILYGYGWGMLLKSTNAGKNIAWSNNGNLGVMHSGRFAFNPHNPDILLATSQDYNSAVTGDGGTTWRYLSVNSETGGWGGYNYGGYAFSTGPNGRMFLGRTEEWNGTCALTVSMDGGTTWTRLKDASNNYLTGNGAHAALGDPSDPNIAFWHQWRTTNGMATGTASDWTKMTNCSAVYAYDPVSKTLYGRGSTNTDVVRSTDQGASWQKIADVNAQIWDMAYDHVRNRLYVNTKDNRDLFQIDLTTGIKIEITSRLPADQFGARSADTVAVDPQDPNIVYVGTHMDLYMTSVAVARSVDGGLTWINLTKQAGGTGLDGGREAHNVRVHPVTGMLWVGTQCFGTYAYAPPEYSSRNYEAENLTIANQSGAAAAPLAISGSNNGQVLEFKTTAAGSYVTLALPNCEATTYKLSYIVRRLGNPGGPGVFQVSVSDNPTTGFVNVGGTSNFYDATPKFFTNSPGEVTFTTPGTKYIRFTCTGRSGGEGFNGNVDAISLVSYVQKSTSLADAFVHDGNPSTALGATQPTTLIVKKDISSWNRFAYLRFSVGPSGPVQSAKVRIYGQRDSGTINPAVAIYPVADTAWNESTITWNQQPTGVGATALASATVTATSQYYEWDVTSYVQQQVAAGKRVVSFVLKSTTNQSTEVVRFNSKDATANRPEFLVKTTW
jgi:hypothetical protein